MCVKNPKIKWNLYSRMEKQSSQNCRVTTAAVPQLCLVQTPEMFMHCALTVCMQSNLEQPRFEMIWEAEK